MFVGQYFGDAGGQRSQRLIEDVELRGLFGLLADIGAKVVDERADWQLEQIRKIDAHAIKTSTLQDLEKGKPLEYDAISGAVVRAARRHNIKVQAVETIYALLRLLDAAPKKF